MSDPRDIPIGYGNCHGCWRHKSGAIWFDPTCPVHSPTPTEPGTPCPYCKGEPMSPDCAICGGSGTTEPGTPQTAAGRALDDEMPLEVIAGGSVREYILAIEAEARAAADLAMVPVIEATAGMAADNARSARDVEYRTAILKEMGWSEIEVDDFLREHGILDADTPS